MALEPTRAPQTRPLSAFASCRYDNPSTRANAVLVRRPLVGSHEVGLTFFCRGGQKSSTVFFLSFAVLCARPRLHAPLFINR